MHHNQRTAGCDPQCFFLRIIPMIMFKCSELVFFFFFFFVDHNQVTAMRFCTHSKLHAVVSLLTPFLAQSGTTIILPGLFKYGIMSGLLCFTHVLLPSPPPYQVLKPHDSPFIQLQWHPSPPPLFKILDTTLPETTYTETIASLNNHIHRRLILNVSDMVVIWIWWQSLCL